MKRPDSQKTFARLRAYNITFDRWLKESRRRAWSVFAAFVVTAVAIEDLAIYLGARGVLHLVLAIPSFYFATESYLRASENTTHWNWKRGLILLGCFFLILGPTSADIARELRVALIVLVAALVIAAAFIGFSRAKKPTIKRHSASHINKDGKPKVPFATEAEARVVADSLTARDGEAMNTYVCGECHQFHIGHARDLAPSARRKR
jgi:hypothetical protein